jgi:hypothetical protein
MRISARKETCSRRHAYRRLHEEVREISAIGCQTIEIRRLDQFITIGTKAIPTVLVGHDEKNVRPVGFIAGRISINPAGNVQNDDQGERAESELVG